MVALLRAAGWELVVGDGAHCWHKDGHWVSLRRAVEIERAGFIAGPGA